LFLPRRERGEEEGKLEENSNGKRRGGKRFLGVFSHYFLFIYIFITVVLGINCDIYQSSYNISNIP
jgi:hypothetical protein